MKIKVAHLGEFDMPDNFTFREMNFIKKMTGLRAGEVYPALEAGDSDVIAAFALTAVRRANHKMTEDDVMDLEISEIEIVVEAADKAEAAAAVDPPLGGHPSSSSNGKPPEPIVSTTEIPVISG